MERIKANIMEHKKMYIGLSILVVLALLCLTLHFVFYRISDISDNIPYADIGDLCAFIAYYIGMFLGILLVGSVFWLIAYKLGSRIHISWFIVVVNTLLVFFDIYIILDDWLNPGWLQGLGTAIMCMFVVPVNIVVYIFCTVRLRMYVKKQKSKKIKI